MCASSVYYKYAQMRLSMRNLKYNDYRMIVFISWQQQKNTAQVYSINQVLQNDVVINTRVNITKKMMEKLCLRIDK